MQFDQPGRRKFITLLGAGASAVLWAESLDAQQELPVVGFLSAGPIGELGYLASAFRQGLSEAALVERSNIIIEYRWADGNFDQLPALAADLVRRNVALIATGGTTVSLIAKAATATIPIVFVSGVDAVDVGLVSSLNRPGANLTGVNLFSNVVTTKRVQLLHELIAAPAPLAILANPSVAAAADRELREVENAADNLGRKIKILLVSNDREVDTAFATMVEQRIGGLLVQVEPFLTSRRDQLVLLTTRHAIPTISGIREFPMAGGLMSYGTDLTAAWRQVGNYAGRILKGEKPADLPVLQPTKFELIINLKSARTLGLDIPATLLAVADAVIE
jgi:putative ABC transport system substrate-binding protein